MHRFGFLSVAVAGLIVGLSALAFGAGDARGQEASIEATVEGAVAAWNDEDIESFVGYFSDAGLEALFSVSRDEAVDVISEQRASDGPIASATVTIESVSGLTEATGIVDLQFEAGFGLSEEWTFQRTEEGWVITDSAPVSQPIPPGVPAVDMELKEYAFVYNEAAMQAADGNFAFSVRNTGEEEHEIVMLKLDSTKPLFELLQSADPESEDLPEGVEFVTFGGFFGPGTEGTTILPEPLSPGKYGLVCFVPAPDGTPHAFLGMVSEFTIGSAAPVTDGAGGGGITPPNTGDGGLAGPGGINVTYVAVAAVVVVVAGTFGLTRMAARAA